MAFVVQYWEETRQVFAYLFAPRWAHVVSMVSSMLF